MKISASEIPSVIAMMYNTPRVPYFVGKPGMGKTAFGRLAAQQLGREHKCDFGLVVLELASIAECDVRGYLIPQGDKCLFTAPVFWDEVLKHERGLILIDEFGQAPHEMQKAIAPLLLEGRIGDYKLPPGWKIVCIGNAVEHNSGSNTLLAHVLNRLTRIEVSPPDKDQWALWAIGAALEPEVIAFAQLRPGIVFESDIPGASDTPWCTPRSLHAASDVAKAYPGGIQQMVAEPVGLCLLAGSIGDGPAGELAALVKTAFDWPTIEEVCADPLGCKIPTELSAQYGVVMMVAVRAQATVHGDAPMRYLMRFQNNLALVGIVALVNKDSAFTSSKVLSDWVINNRALLAKFHKFVGGA